MARNINFTKELQLLEKMAGSQKAGRRQYAFRLNPVQAVTFVRDCIERNQQPGRRAEEIVLQYYEAWSEGLYVKNLDPKIRDAMDALAELWGVDRSTAFIMVVARNLPEMLAEAASQSHKREQARKIIVESLEKTRGTPAKTTTAKK